MADEDYTTDDDMDVEEDDIQIVLNVALFNAAFNPVLANQLPLHQQAQLAQMMQQIQNQPVHDNGNDDWNDDWYLGR
ncbi:hypothetical protein Klosneuvirus_6_80 [Klosneuvirus KNV1]|uniref:Uncharacterized protein n=1 Tax=Klosneuvirus KNV1 TaxID=1977640 RepID=A0A1V0SLL8_9VIRU|nr:hypothetical protein Klosneuvirus_6_80 [Klosneuvirus KNV1]